MRSFCHQLPKSPISNKKRGLPSPLVQTKYHPQFYGDLGKDMIWGDFGDDFIRGGTLNPTSTLDVESDLLFGNRGQDTLIGDAGDDTLWGGKDNDLLQGEAGSDRPYPFTATAKPV